MRARRRLPEVRKLVVKKKGARRWRCMVRPTYIARPNGQEAAVVAQADATAELRGGY